LFFYLRGDGIIGRAGCIFCYVFIALLGYVSNWSIAARHLFHTGDAASIFKKMLKHNKREETI
jgi:hypothetical protein